MSVDCWDPNQLTFPLSKTTSLHWPQGTPWALQHNTDDW